MVLQSLSILLHSIASAGGLAPLGKLNNLVAYDTTEGTLQARKHGETHRRQALRKIAALKQLDASQLPLVATDRSAFERALLEAGSITNQSKSPSRNNARNNGSSSKQKIHTATEMRLEPWIHKAFASEFRFNKETI